MNACGNKLNRYFISLAVFLTVLGVNPSWAGITEVENFVIRFYQLCLDRNPDDNGLDGWVSALLDGSQTGSDVAYGFIFSAEFEEKNTRNSEFLEVLYKAFFDRNPDPSGRDIWLAELDAGQDRLEVLNGFINSPEFIELCNAFGILAVKNDPDTPEEFSEAFVTRFYDLCLDRTPDPAGLAGWADALLSGADTGADIAQGFVFSKEFIAKGTSDSEFLLILYKAFFNRDPDQGGWEAWMADLKAGNNRKDVLDGFIYSNEFTGLCSQFGIKAYDSVPAPKSPFAGTWEGAMFPGHYIEFEVEDINGDIFITSANGSYVAIGCFNEQYAWETNQLQSKIVKNESQIHFPDEINYGDGRGMELHFYFDSDTKVHGTWIGETFCKPLIDGTFEAYRCVDKDQDGYDSCNECDDTNAAINWDADEICDGVDNDCDGEIDEGLFYPDIDGDGYGDANAAGQSCPVPENYVKDNTDCDDSNTSINPENDEISRNFLDDNCDGQIDEGFETISNISINSPGVIAMSPNGDYLYVTNSSEQSVRVLRTSDNTLIDTLSVDGEPYSLSITRDGKYLYVAYVKYYHSTKSNLMSIIQTSDNTVIDKISLGYYVGSGGISVLPDGDYVYLANNQQDSVSVLRTSDNAIINTIPVGDFPSNLIAAPNGDRVYVSNFLGPSISVIRISDNTVTNTIPTGFSPGGMTVTKAGDYVYVTGEGPDTVSAIRTSDNTITDIISVGLNPRGIAVSPDGKYVYVANRGEVTYCPGCPAGNTENWRGCSVSVILASNSTVLHNIPMGNGPTNIAIDPDGDHAYVTVPQENSITVIGFPD